MSTDRLALDAAILAIICKSDEVGQASHGMLMTRKCGTGTRRRFDPAVCGTDELYRPGVIVKKSVCNGKCDHQF